MDETLYTVGELAKRMRVSVRTLQYYDRQGLLHPSAHSGGGRRLYSPKDVVRLQQILSLKYLGLSLEEIKQKLPAMEDRDEVKRMLQQQASSMQAQIERLQKAVGDIRLLQREIDALEKVDFSKIADIIILLRLQDGGDWWSGGMFASENSQVLKGHIEKRTAEDEAFGLRVAARFETISQQMYGLVRLGEAPGGERGQAAAKELWDMVQDFLGGDMALLPNLMLFNEEKGGWPEELKQRQEAIEDFMGQALGQYVAGLGTGKMEV